MPSVENFKAVWLPGLAQAQPVAALLVLLHAEQFPEEVVRVRVAFRHARQKVPVKNQERRIQVRLAARTLQRWNLERLRHTGQLQVFALA